MSQQGKWFKQRYYRNFKTSVGQCYFQVTSNLNISRLGKWFKQRYNRNLNILRICRPVFLSGNSQSEHVTAVEMVQKTILLEN